MLIGSVNSRSNVTQRLEEDIVNAGAPTYGDQVPPLEQDSNMEKALANPVPCMDKKIRTVFLQMSQAITTKAQESMDQAQAMTAHANWEVVPRLHQQATTMACRLRDFIRMNPHTSLQV